MQPTLPPLPDKNSGEEKPLQDDENGGNVSMPIVDLTSTNAAPDSPFVICKIPYDIYNKVLKIVDAKKPQPPPAPKPKPVAKKKKRKRSYKVKGTWSKDEDQLLKSLVDKFGAKKWPNIAEHMKGRNGKQCRERYLNHLDDSINHSEWNETEDELIIQLHDQHGNQWAKMSRKLQGRPANMIKNRWNSTLNKVVAQRRGIELKKPARKKKKKKAPKKTRRKKKKSNSEDDDGMGIGIQPPQLEQDIDEYLPTSKSFCYPLPPDYRLPETFPFPKMGEKRHAPPHEDAPPTKRQKTPHFDLTLNFDEEIENPFPSPRNLDSKGEQTDMYKNLIMQNRKINQHQADIFGDTSLDEKLGIGSGIQELKDSKDLEKRGYEKNDNFKLLNLSLNESAMFASDYGINLGSPAHLSLELWSPRFSDQKPKDSKNNYLKINVHPVKDT